MIKSSDITNTQFQYIVVILILCVGFIINEQGNCNLFSIPEDKPEEKEIIEVELLPSEVEIIREAIKEYKRKLKEIDEAIADHSYEYEKHLTNETLQRKLLQAKWKSYVGSQIIGPLVYTSFSTTLIER